MSRINLSEYIANMVLKPAFSGFEENKNSFENFSLWLNKKTSSQNFIAFLTVAAIHLSALFALFYQFNNNANNVVLSFSITSFDVSASSSNVVSSVLASAGGAKATTKSESETNAANSTKSSASANQQLTQNSELQNKGSQSFNSSQQTAVIAPTTPASFDAAYLNNEAPIYPALSRRLEEQGIVLLNVLVDENGKAQSVAVKKSSGFERLDEAALKTVQKWRFIAAKNDGKIVASFVQVPVKFVLEK